MTGEVPRDVLIVAGTLLRAVTLPAGLLIGGSAGAALLLRRLGCPPAAVDRAARRLARPLLALLLLAVLPLAVVETLWETEQPLNLPLFTDLLPYLLVQTLSGLLLIAQAAVLIGLCWRLRAGHPPGLAGSLALLIAWPPIGHLVPNYAILDADALAEIGWLGVHRAGAALWLGTLTVLLIWSRPSGPADRPWGVAFFRLALPGAGLLLAGALGTVLGHGGWAAVAGPGPFALLVDLKLGLLGALLLLGARHFRRYRAAGPAVPGTLAAEVATALIAVLLGALLGVLPSPGG